MNTLVDINSKRHYEWLNLPCPFCQVRYDLWVTLEIRTNQNAGCPNCEKGKHLEVAFSLPDDKED